MKKILPAVILLSLSMLASEYYAKIQPLKSHTIKSSVSGKVVFADDSLEGQTVSNQIIISLDDYINKIDLENSKTKLKTLKEILNIEEETLKSFNKVSSKSKFDKDNQKIKILNYVSQIADLTTKIKTLEDTIKNKKITTSGDFIYDVMVSKGDYVNPGTPLLQTLDLTKGKIEIFIPIDKVNSIKNKKIFIDGKKTDLKISKLYRVADKQHLSSYKCEIVLPNPVKFSKLIKVEFK